MTTSHAPVSSPEGAPEAPEAGVVSPVPLSSPERLAAIVARILDTQMLDAEDDPRAHVLLETGQSTVFIEQARRQPGSATSEPPRAEASSGKQRPTGHVHFTELSDSDADPHWQRLPNDTLSVEETERNLGNIAEIRPARAVIKAAARFQADLAELGEPLAIARLRSLGYKVDADAPHGVSPLNTRNP